MVFYKILDSIILVFAVLVFVSVLAFEYETLGLQTPLIDISSEWKPFFELFFYVMIFLLVIDLVLKYRKTNNLKKFMKKYWIDIGMLLLIPILSTFKFFKIGLSLIKKLKTAKIGVKILHKIKKVSGS